MGAVPHLGDVDRRLDFVEHPARLSARIWRGISPVLFQESAQGFTFGLTPEMLQTLVVSISAVVLLFFYLLIYRVRLEELRDQVIALKRALQ